MDANSNCCWAYGDTTALVGTPDTIIASLLDYVDLGVTTFLNRGYDPIYDTSIMVVILSPLYVKRQPKIKTNRLNI